ncbi:MAG: FmdB family zinc ribbon protein [Ignavibacteriales bacterium]
MPIYEYECDRCGRFDHWQSITSEPLAECPKCGARVRRLISGNIGVIFKGSGFYCTDHRSQKAGASSAEEGSNASSRPADSGKPKDSGESTDSGKK